MIHTFPAELPIECVRDIITIVGDDDVLHHKGILMEHVGQAIGQVGAIVKGWEGPAAFGSGVDVCVTSLKDCCSQLEAARDAQVQALDGGVGSSLIDALLAKLIEILLTKLNEWLNS